MVVTERNGLHNSFPRGCRDTCRLRPRCILSTMLARRGRGFATTSRRLVSDAAYDGPGYDDVLRIRSENLAPCIKSHFRKPLLVHRGRMQWLYDHEGKRYLDMFAGIVTVSVGHCHPRVTDALRKQISTLWHTTNIYMHPKVHEYAEALAGKLPGNLKVAYFVNSGSEANDVALLMARLHTGNSDVIALRNAYHGGANSTIALTALNTWKFPMHTHNIHYAKNADVYGGAHGGRRCRDSPVQAERDCDCEGDSCRAADAYADEVREIVEYELPRGRLAAFFAESIQGVGGAVQYPRGYLKKVYKLVRDNGGVCIADEVQTGFGRTGSDYWGFQNHGVVPDIVTMAKGIGNGFPLGAVVTTPEIAGSLTKALHFNTFGGNPMASAVGLEVLRVIDDEGMQENSRIVGSHLLERLRDLRERFEVVGDVRGKGLMIGVEMVEDKSTRKALSPEAFGDVWEACKDAGVLLGVGGLRGNVFRIKPPMCVTREDADLTVDVLEEAIKKAKLP